MPLKPYYFPLMLVFILFFARETSAENLTIKSSEGRAVVTVTYKNPEEKKGPVFLIKMNSTSINLKRYKIEDISTLKDDKGKKYKGTWKSEYARRRHRLGTLTFTGIDLKEIKKLELSIERLASTKTRIFTWKIKK